MYFQIHYGMDLFYFLFFYFFLNGPELLLNIHYDRLLNTMAHPAHISKIFVRFLLLSNVFTSCNAIGSVKLDAIPPVENHRLAAFTYPNESMETSDIAGLADKVCRVLEVQYSQCFYSTFTNKKTNSIDIEVYSLVSDAVVK